MEGKDVLAMVVPEAGRAHKPVYLKANTDLAYLRRGESDVQCNRTELDRLIRESQQHTADNDVIDYLDFSDLDTPAVRRYRELCAELGVRHLRDNPDDREFLTRIGVWRHDRQSGAKGLTRGGILMLGNDLAIHEIRENHVIDFRLQDNLSFDTRWRDRRRWTGHLFGAWEEITPRLVRVLPVPFRLVGTTRVDDPAGEQTIREALVNLLIHTDYVEISDARVIVTNDGCLFDNPGPSRVRVDSPDYDAPEYFPPSERRNPLISSLFAQIGQAEQAGSGVRSMRQQWRELGYQAPRFQNSIEGYRFSVFLSLRSMIGAQDRQWLKSMGGPWTEHEEFALLLARDAERVDNQQLREITGMHPADATRLLQGLRDKGALIQNGYGKWTYYSLAGQRAGRTQLNIDLGRVDSESNAPEKDTSSGHSDTSSSHKDTSSSHSEEQWGRLEAIAAPVARAQRTSPTLLQGTVLQLCQIAPLTRSELITLLNRSPKTVNRITTLLMKDGRLRHEQASATSPYQRYIATHRRNSKGIQ